MLLGSMHACREHALCQDMLRAGRRLPQQRGHGEQPAAGGDVQLRTSWAQRHFSIQHSALPMGLRGSQSRTTSQGCPGVLHCCQNQL